MTRKRATLKSRALLSLSLEGQRVSEIEDRVLKSGGPMNQDTLKTILKKLVDQGLAHVEYQGNALSYRLAVGAAVEAALDEAWAEVQGKA